MLKFPRVVGRVRYPTYRGSLFCPSESPHLPLSVNRNQTRVEFRLEEHATSLQPGRRLLRTTIRDLSVRVAGLCPGDQGVALAGRRRKEHTRKLTKQRPLPIQQKLDIGEQ